MNLLRGLRRSRDITRFDLCITCDANQESGVGKVIDEICGPTSNHFATKSYGVGLNGIGIVLMCRDPELNFKQRIRLSKIDGKLYADIMLNLDEMKRLTHATRKQIVCERLINEVPPIVHKYSIPDFDERRFTDDLRAWLGNLVSESGLAAE